MVLEMARICAKLKPKVGSAAFWGDEVVELELTVCKLL